MKQPLLFLWMAACALLLPSSAQEDPWLPERWFEDVSAPDGSLHASYIFVTTPGCLYEIQSSENLTSWETISMVYGLGQEVVISLREKAPAPPPPPGNPPAEPPSAPAENVSLLMTPATGGGTVVSWRSLDYGHAITFHIAGSLHPDWQNVPLFAERYEDYQFFVTHPSGSVTPPAENPLLETRDATMMAILEASLPAMNQAVVNSTFQARNAPAPPPPTSAGRAFIRLKVNFGLDSDADGIPDPVEFAMMANGNPYGSPFNPDTDGDGVLDGEVVDSDGDATPDIRDSGVYDPTFSSPLIALPRYAFFPLGSGETLNKINDKGMVVFWPGGAVWQGGKVSTLPQHNPQAGGIYTFDDQGRILGSVEMQNPLRAHARLWASPTAAPALLTHGTGAQARFPASMSNLANDGRFVAMTHRVNDPAGEAWWQLWQVDGQGALTRTELPDERLRRVGEDGILFGTAPQEDGSPRSVVYRNGTSLGAFSGVAEKVMVVAGVPLASRYLQENHLPTLAHVNGSWVESKAYRHALDICEDGTAVGRDVPGMTLPVLLNGKWQDIERTAPDVPAAWREGELQWVDASPQGWLLGKRKGAEPEPFALLPLRVEGRYTASDSNLITYGVGVDDFSIGSTEPDSPPENPGDPPPLNVRDRIWIMAPQGGPAKSVTVRAPLNVNTKLKVSGSGLKFDGEDSIELMSGQTTFHLTADSGDGQDMTLDLAFVRQEGGAAVETPSLSKPLGVKVMKHRTVRVTVWQVASEMNPMNVGEPGYLPGLVIPPKFQPTKEELDRHLTDMFLPQFNTSFDCTIKPVQPVRYDTADGTAYGVAAGHMLPHNFQLNVNNQLGLEMETIRAACHDPNANINLYLVGGAHEITLRFWLEFAQMLHMASLHGAADTERRHAWVAAGLERGEVRYLDTISHEIGHVIVGKGHPDKEGGWEMHGPAPLPGTDPKKRLMASGGVRRKDGTARILTKGEWDRAVQWLQDEEANDRM